MTKEEFIKKIEEEITILEEEKNTGNDLLTFCNDFCLKNNHLSLNSFNSFDSNNMFDFSILYFLASRNGINLTESKELLYPLQQIITNVPCEETGKLINYIGNIIATKQEQLLISLIDSKNLKSSITNSINIYKNIPSVKLLHYMVDVGKIIVKYHLDREEMIDLVHLAKNYPREILDIANVIYGVKMVQLLKEKLSNEEFTKKIDKYLDRNYLYEKFEKITNFNQSLMKKKQSRIIKIQKKQDSFQDFLKDFSIDESQEITNYKDMLNKINVELRLDALKLIYQHNEKIYDNISKEYSTLIQDKKLRYQKLFNSYDLTPATSSFNLLLNRDYKELEDSLIILKKFNIENNLLFYILENSHYKTLEEINLYFERKIINKKFIKNNYLILIPTSNEYINLNHNIKALEQEGINPNIFTLSTKVLLTDFTLFSTNINILKEYKLLHLIKTTINYNFLQDTNLANKIDKLLELNMETFLEQDLSLLNNKNIDRLYILRELNIPIDNLEDLTKVLTTKNFYVSDENIFNYVFTTNLEDDEDNYSNSLITLDKFPSTLRTLIIGDVCFSKNKIKRNLESNNNLKKALFKDTILTTEEQESVLETLEGEKINTYKN